MRWLAILTLIAAGLPLCAADVYVSSGGSDTSGNGSSANPVQTIGKGVTIAASGDTIHIAAGTYLEQLTLGKNLVLAGDGATTTSIQCPPVLSNNVPNITTPAAPATALVAVLGATVSLSGVTIAGPGSANCNSIGFGIFCGGGGTAIVSACRVASIRDNPLSGCQNGRAVAAGSTALGQSGSVALDGVEVGDYQKSGLSVEGTASSLSASQCTITGVGPTTALPQNGILIADGAAATVANCRITENNFTPGPTASCGLLVIGDSSRVKIGGLTFSGNNANIVGLAIAITSLPTATPNPAQPGDEVTLTVAGAVSTGSITYAWDFGDGTALGGDSVKHTWMADGIYRAEVTLTSTAGNSQKTFIDVTVRTPPVDPNVFEPLNVVKKNVRGKNPTQNKDSFRLSGTFELPEDATSLDGTLQFSIGAAAVKSVEFAIDTKGKAAKDPNKNTFKLRAKARKGVLQTRTVKFQAKLVGDFLKVLEGAGLPAGSAGNVKIPIRMTYKDTLYGQDVDLSVKASKKGFSGK